MTRRAAMTDSHAGQLDLPWFGDGATQSLPHGGADAPAVEAGGTAKLLGAPAAADLATGRKPLPALFRHPRAEREIDLGKVRVAYEFRRARRRTIGMVVSAEGLSVRAPRWVGLADVEAALREKSAWIQAKLAEQHDRARRHEAARIEWRDGTTLPFLGRPVTVRLDARTTGVVLDAGDAAAAPVLRVGLPQGADPQQLRDAIQAWLKRQAKRVFEERAAHYAALLGVRVRRLSLSSAQTRWGSASADGSVRLHWRLVHFAMPTIDYVVAHELAHLRHMDHSPRFWDVVRSVIPDLERARGTLRDGSVPLID